MVFCHSPDNKIYELSPSGSTVRVFATLPAPYPPAADGALAFDSVGRFGYRLIAATGRSGGPTPSGGTIYAIDAAGHVGVIGGYRGPGGADEVMIAPPTFGALGGDALLSVDAGAHGGRVVAIAPGGRGTNLVAFSGDGPNPVVAVPTALQTSGTPLPGVYITDDITKDIYYISAAQLTAYRGDLLVATETMGQTWILQPVGRGVRAEAIGNTLPKKGHGIEQAIYVG
jgi:hypothetical protein